MQPTKKTWRIQHPAFNPEITLHAEGESHTPASRGIYCYYLYIHESKVTPEQFASLWLEDEIVKWGDTSPERVTHAYNSLPVLEHVDFHGGITFYDKRGYSPGHRCVILGCDFNHIWDMESPPSFEYVKGKALQTADQLAKYFYPQAPADET